jgi:hypothetical protein
LRFVIAALRWLAIVPAILAAWFLSFASGVGLIAAAKRLCPPEHLVSGMCTARWYPHVETAIFCVSTALAAALIVGASALLAPSRKAVVASVVFAGGIAYAVYFAVATGLWPSFTSTVIAGAFVLWIVVRRAR